MTERRRHCRGLYLFQFSQAQNSFMTKLSLRPCCCLATARRKGNNLDFEIATVPASQVPRNDAKNQTSVYSLQSLVYGLEAFAHDQRADAVSDGVG